MALSNNAQRVIVSIIAIPLILSASYFGGLFFLFFVLAVALVSYFEFFALVKKKEINAQLITGFFAVAFLIVNQYRYFFDVYSFLIAIVVLLTFIELFRNNGSPVHNIGATLLGIFYIGLFASTLVGIREFFPPVGDLYLRGGYLIIAIFASIWICDSAAYYIGTSFGRHKLFVRVSPKKSWEGAVAGFIFAVLTFIAAKYIFLDFLTLSSAVALGMIVGVIGQFGDLIESLIKRDAGIKDSSSLIPGHGGIFDRFDSILYSAPVILLYLKYFSR
ncbi:MAG: phosphatidate cytidylyltransferase [Ignavibacteriaceae bacterium]